MLGSAPRTWWFGAIVLVCLITLAGCAASDGVIAESDRVLSDTAIAQNNAGGTQTPQTLPPQETQIAAAPDETATAPVPTPTVNGYDFSVLTAEQRERLYQVSLTFLASTEEEAIEVADRLNYIDQWGHPETFCGPLSVGILQKAGLVDRTVDLHDFWLLDPRDEFTISQILEKTFPTENYLWYRTTTPLNEFDFNEFPLYSGDFLYLYAGPAGTFEHMLTVTRVDGQGRAYGISAENYSGEYAISELMLYDPNDPGVGFFYDLTNRAYMFTTGITGFGGFQLWRPIIPIDDPPSIKQALQDQLDPLFETSRGDWHVQVKEIGGETLYVLEENAVIHPGSVIKVPLAMLFLESFHDREIIDLPAFLDTHGMDGRTYSQLLRAMLVNSEEPATDTLYDYTNPILNIPSTLEEWGYEKTVISPRQSTASEMSAFFEDIWQQVHVSDVENEIIKAYLFEYTSGDDSRIGVIREAMPEDVRYYSKRGSLFEGQVIVSEVAVIEFEDRAFILSIFGYPNVGENMPTYDDLEDTIEEAAWIIWDAIRDYP